MKAGQQTTNSKDEKEERINRLYRKGWNPRRVLAGYFSVYITEGMVRSIMFIMPLYLMTGMFGLAMVERGFILVMAYVPWHFKFLIGLGMDASPAIGAWRRRIYIVLGTGITVLGVLWLASATDIWLAVLPALIIVMAGDALIDTGMDALLLDVTPPDWHGTGVGVGWGARAIGVTISMTLTMFVQSLWGWTAAIYLFALFSLPALLAVFIREPRVTEERRVSKLALAETFTDRRMLGWVGFALFGAIIYVMDPTRGFISEMLSSLSFGESDIFALGIVLSSSIAVSSFATGRLADRIGHKRSFYISLTGAVISVLLFMAFGSGAIGPALYAIIALLGFFGAFNIVSYFALLADTIPPKFTAFMWQFEMGWLHVSAFFSGTFIAYALGAGHQAALLGLALIMLAGFIPARLMKSTNASKGEIR